MHDTLPGISHIEEGDAIFAHVAFQRGNSVMQRGVDHVEHTPPRCGWYIVIEYSDGRFWFAHRAPGGFEAGECLRRCDLMHKVTVNVEYGGFAGNIAHNMGIP